MRIIIDNKHIGRLRSGVNFADFCKKHPNSSIHKITYDININDPKQMDKLQNMVFDGTCFTPDGCIVEPDGSCEHGLKSWLLIYGLI